MRSNSPCKSYLDQRWQTKAGYHSPSFGLSWGQLWREQHANLWLSCRRCCSPLAVGSSEGAQSSCDKVWRGADYTCQQEGWLERRKGREIEDRANRDERNPSVLIASQGWFFFFFFPSTIVCRIGPGPVRRIMQPKLLVADLTSFHWLRRVTFFVFGAWRNVKPTVTTHTCI